MTLDPLRRTFGTIAFKQSLILLAMGGATAAAIGIGLYVYGALSISINNLTDEVLPEIETSLDVMAQTDQARNAVNALKDASTPAEVARGNETFGTNSTNLSRSIADLPEDAASSIAPMMESLVATVDRMNAANIARFEATSRLAEQLQELQDVSENARSYLAEHSDTAVFDLVMGGEETLTEVRTILAGLTDREFGRMQAVLNLRSEVNLVTGLSLALIDTRDPSFNAILRDLVVAANDRLDRLLGDMATSSAGQDGLAPVTATRDFVNDLEARGFARRPGIRETLLRMRQDSDAALSSLVDDLSFSLAILAEDTATQNEDAVRSLLDDQVGRILTAGNMDVAVKDLFVTALLGATEENVNHVDGAQAALNTGWTRLETLANNSTMDDELRAMMEAISAVVDPDTGILASRHAYLNARNVAAERSDEAGVALSTIAGAAQAQGAKAVSSVAQASQSILAESLWARDQMHTIAWAGVAIIMVSMIFTWLMILRPMGRVTSETERLATGNLEPVTGFERTYGEIGRMARALGVFRDGLLERQEMEAQEKQREIEAREAEKRAEEEARKAEEAARADKAKKEQQERDKQAAERAREEEQQRQAQAERDARAAEQGEVVACLAGALDRLSRGDLTTSIDTSFPGAYEELRCNFNTAVGTLAELIQSLLESASTVDSSSAEIANAANDLAKRTERNAASIEQTAAAVVELDASARSSSESAQEAADAMSNVRTQADAGNATMQDAVSTMSDIEESSHEISKIVNLIEDIAFQTQLLALNAGVEAARAGAEGQGFAVVATEVRNLAQRSADAVGEINSLISSTHAQITRGVSQVDQAGSALTTILSSVANVSIHIQSIAQSASEQATTISEIGDAVTGLDQSTQQNAAMFQESLASSTLLREESATLMGLANEFRTDKAAPQTYSDIEPTAASEPMRYAG